MNYADFNYYKTEYKGTLSAEKFNALLKKASVIIDENINRELDKEKFSDLSARVQDRVKYVLCTLVDLLDKKEKSNKDISSISIDGVSKTYKTITENEYRERKIEVLRFLPEELTKLW